MITQEKTKLFLFVKNILSGDFRISITDNQKNAIIDLFKNLDDYMDDDIFQVELFTRCLIRLCIFSKV